LYWLLRGEAAYDLKEILEKNRRQRERTEKEKEKRKK
jgi:hypothetical protein